MAKIKETLKMKERHIVRHATSSVAFVARGRFKRGELSKFNFDQIKRNLAEIERCIFNGS